MVHNTPNVQRRGLSYPCCRLHVPPLDSALPQLRTPPETKAKRGGVSASGEEAVGGFRVNVYRVNSADEASPHSLCAGALTG